MESYSPRASDRCFEVAFRASSMPVGLEGSAPYRTAGFRNEMSMSEFIKRLAAIALSLLAVSPLGAMADDRVVYLYNWNDYFAEDTLAHFQERTGIHPVLDVYDSNEILEAKLLAGSSGYDLVFPTARPFAVRHIKAGLYAELDKDRLPGLKRLDAEIMRILADLDPGNSHLVPYMWGTTGLGINPPKVVAALGKAPENSWTLLFDPKMAEKLAGCGIALLDDPTEVVAAALAYLGKDPNSRSKDDLAVVRDLLAQVRPHIRYFHSSQYISDLANGDICVAMGYSGDVIQARSNAQEADNGVEIAYLIPKEGAMLWIDVMAIPADAPNPEQAHAFIEHLLDPEVIAAASNHVYFANANTAATEHLEKELRIDPGIHPSAEVRSRLFVGSERSDREIRALNRLWTRLKANR